MDVRKKIVTEILESNKDTMAATAKYHDREAALAQIESCVNDMFERYLNQLSKERQKSLLNFFPLLIDEKMRTDEMEYIDRNDFPEERRKKMIHDLDRLNRSLFNYEKFLWFIRPMVKEMNKEGRLKIRHLDLGSGHGAFPIALWKLGQKRNIQFETTGSDICEHYVEVAQENAKKSESNVSFTIANAFNLEQFPDNSFDLVTCTQTLHHFTPGQLAKMFCEALRVSAHSVLFIDGKRSLHLVPALGIVTYVVTRNFDLVHDGIISMRRMYHEEELRLIASLAQYHRPFQLKISQLGFTHSTVYGKILR